MFHVASVSKQFTAIALVLLEADRKLSLEDDIHKYLPELPDYGKPITIRNLLQHTGGIRDQWQHLIIGRYGLTHIVPTEGTLYFLLHEIRRILFLRLLRFLNPRSSNEGESWHVLWRVCERENSFASSTGV